MNPPAEAYLRNSPTVQSLHAAYIQLKVRVRVLRTPRRATMLVSQYPLSSRRCSPLVICVACNKAFPLPSRTRSLYVRTKSAQICLVNYHLCAPFRNSKISTSTDARANVYIPEGESKNGVLRNLSTLI